MKIVTLKPTQNNDALEVLEEMMKMVKSGECTAVTVCWVTKDGSIGGDLSKGDNNFAMLASIENTHRHFKQLIFGDPI